MTFDSAKCPFCGGKLRDGASRMSGLTIATYCDHCGPYVVPRRFLFDLLNYTPTEITKSKIASYLYYHTNHDDPYDDLMPYISSAQIETPDEYRCVTIQEINNWYPKSFREKVDLFLLNMDSRSHFLGDSVLFTDQMQYSAFFVDRDPKGPMAPLPNAVTSQATYFENYLIEQGYISKYANTYKLLPKGLARVDELQQSQPKNSKNAFIAMSFAPKNKPVREAIKEALIDCGYDPRIMDEVEHNNQIVPEMLYEIRESRFLVAELSDKNNGAYFEAGYAMGQGKEVIFVCGNEAFASNAHFDIKQANTITWKDPDDLKNRLIARIKATIS